MTDAQRKALTILRDTSYDRTMSAGQFAKAMWSESHPHLFTKVSNQGNGATSGKAAWLSGGSFLAKLRKLGWLWNDKWGRYYITSAGKEALFK